MVTFFLTDGRQVALPTATTVSAEAYGAAVACYDAASRLLGRFLLADLTGYVAGEQSETSDSAPWLQAPSLDHG